MNRFWGRFAPTIGRFVISNGIPNSGTYVTISGQQAWFNKIKTKKELCAPPDNLDIGNQRYVASYKETYRGNLQGFEPVTSWICLPTPSNRALPINQESSSEDGQVESVPAAPPTEDNPNPAGRNSST